jgi:hypothetical protein
MTTLRSSEPRTRRRETRKSAKATPVDTNHAATTIARAAELSRVPTVVSLPETPNESHVHTAPT